MTAALVLALIILSILIAGIVQIIDRGLNWLAWSVLALAVAVLFVVGVH